MGGYPWAQIFGREILIIAAAAALLGAAVVIGIISLIW